MGFEHMAREREIQTELKKYGGKRFPHALDTVILEDGTSWHVGNSDEEKGLIFIWRPEYGGGGYHPMSSPGYSIREKRVTIGDVRKVF
jgi:hypothetical protein